MRQRLLYLLDRWAERESVRLNPKIVPLPEPAFIWIKDKLGRWHHGSLDRYGHLIPLLPSWCLTAGTCRPVFPHSVLDEFEVAFRKLGEQDQGLVVTGRFGGDEGWSELIRLYEIPKRNSERILRIAWLRLTIECANRGLV